MDSETCCIQRRGPEACGFTASEAAALMAAAAEAAGTATSSGTKVNDYVEDSRLPEWKNRCIRLYGDCENQNWADQKGSCFACFERCTGDHEWPFDLCRPKKGR